MAFPERVKAVALLALFLVLAGVVSGNAEGVPAGRIADMRGDVSYRERDNVPYRPAQKDLGLEKGFWIKTGGSGWAVLLLLDGSKLTLANNTEIEISDFLVRKNRKSGIFKMAQGKLRASVIRLAGERVNYRIKSPTAVAGIKGTEFMMMTQGPANVCFGNEGTAELSGDGGQGKKLEADTMVQNTRGYAPTDPVKIEPDTPLSEAKKGFEAITAADPPADWDLSGSLPHIIARWNINHGHYLSDSGKHEEALHVFQIALDLSDNPEIRSDARMERAAVYSRFLRNPEAALAEYLLILEEYPRVPQRETTLYLTGMTLYELGFKEQATERLLQYKREFPSGKHLSNVDTILNVLSK
ncbi:MAG: FecR domain-containing protein [Pseudomonadota bacterium]